MNRKRKWTAAVASAAAAVLILAGFVTYHFTSTSGGTNASNSVNLGVPTSPPTTSPTSTVTSSTVNLSAGGSASLPLPAGGSLTIPARSVAGNGTLTARTVAAPAPPPAGAVLDGDTYDIQVNNTQLTNNVTFNLPAPVLAGPDEAIIAYYDTSSQSWIPVATSYQNSTHMAVATSNRPSVWCVFRVDAGSLRTWMDGTFTSFLNDGNLAARPTCANSDQAAAAGISVNSSAGSLVKWCVGESNDQVTLTIANDRRFAVAFDYPQQWSPQAASWSDLDTAVIDGLSGLRTTAPAGDQISVIPGGETMTFVIPNGAPATAHLAPSPAAYLTSAFIYGANTLVETVDRTPFAVPPRSGAALATVQAALHDQNCLASAQSALDASVTDASSADAAFWQSMSVANSCLSKEWVSVNGDSDFRAPYVSGVYAWLVNGLQPYGQSLGAGLDSNLYWQGYNVAIASSGAPAAPTGPAGPPSGTTTQPSTAPTGPSAPSTSTVPTLGQQSDPQQDGLGQVKPSRISFGGDPLSLVTGVTWSSWGGATATGTGTADYVTGSESVAQGSVDPVIVVASDLGVCNGVPAYLEVAWYFPEHGQTLAQTSPFPTCPGG